ncbi:phage tail protein [Pseudooceanicola nanhaiensis]|uniref:phage tail protein n=2 Tax=Rhodobacterales TaxID=204455 RepID=UPI003514198D
MIRRLLLAAVLAVGLSTPARADPVTAAIATALGGTAFASTVASAITRIIVGVALSALSRALQPKQSSKAPGIKTDYTSSGETMAQSFILGRYATGGSFVAPPMSHGQENRTLNYVIDLADMPIEGLTKVYIDGEAVNFNGAVSPNGWGPTADGRFAGRAWLKFHDGSQTAADPELLDRYGSDPERPWSADMILRGVPYVVLTFMYDREVFSGLPRVRFEAEGVPLYDPRLDSTVGGSGAHRWTDKATWAWTENPVVMAYNILRGIELPDGSIWGMRAAAADLPLSVWFAAMNACDEDVPLDGGGTEKRYRAGLEVKVDEEPLAVIEELMRACGGDVVEFGGYWHVSVGAPDLPTLSITDEDLIVSSPRDYEPFPGLAETYNAVHAVYPSPENGWDPTDAVPIYNATWEAEDGGRRLVADLQLDAVGFDTQVRRLMRELAEDKRRFRVHVVTLPPDALGLVPLGTLSWTSAHNSYTNKLFEVVRKVIDPETLLSTLLIRERDPSDYDIDPASDAVVPTPPSRYITTPTIDGIDGWAVTAVAITDASGVSRRPAIRMTWNTDIVAEAIAWLIRVKATGAEVARGTMQDLTAGQIVIAEGILSATEYEVRGRAISRKGTEWTVWSTIETLDVRLGQADFSDAVAGAIFPETPDVPTGLVVGSSLAADGRAVLTADWNDADGAVQYEIGISESGGNEVILLAGTSYFSETDIRPNTAFSVRVRAVGSLGDKSAWSGAVSHTTVKDTTPPPTPTLDPIVEGIDVLWLSWTLTEPPDISHYEILERATAHAPGASTTPTFTSPAKLFVRAGLPPDSLRNYWVRAVDSSDNKSDWSAMQSGKTAGSPEITSEDLAGLVEQTSFATGLTAVEILDELPTVGNFPGRPVVLTTDWKLYRYDGDAGAFTRKVDGADLVADSVTAAAIGAAAVNTRQLAAGAATIEKLSIRDWTNLLENPGFEDEDDEGGVLGWSLAGALGDWSHATGGSFIRAGNRALQHSNNGVTHNQAAKNSNTIDVAQNDQFLITGYINGDATFSNAGVRLVWYDASGAVISTSSADITGPISWGTYSRASDIVTAPTGAAKASFDVFVNGQSSGIIRWDDCYWSRANAGELVVDGGIKARHMSLEELITNTAQIKNGIVSDAKITNLSAAKLLAGTTITSSVLVNGTALGTIQAYANDPAARINAASTQILPGKVIISGATTLDHWRRGNTTEIDGNRIYTGTVLTDALGAQVVTTVKLAAGAATLDKLAVGAGKNLYNDAQFALGDELVRPVLSGGVGTQSATGVRSAGLSWAGKNFDTLNIYQVGTATDGFADLWQCPEPGSTDSRCIPVTPNAWYEFTAYITTRRCGGELFLRFVDENGNGVGSPSESFGEFIGAATNPDRWPRRRVKGQAPATAAFVQAVFRKHGTDPGWPDSQMYIHKPMIAEVHEQATQAAPWSPGGQTLMSGDMIKTGFLDARRVKIDDVTLDTDGAGNLLIRTNGVGTNQLANNAVTRMAATARASQSLGSNESNWVGCMEVSMPMVGGYELFIQVMGEVYIGTDVGGGPQFVWRILVNGTQVWKSRNNALSMIKTHVATSVAGASIPVRIEVDTNGTGGFVNLFDMSLAAIEFKK